MLNIIIGLAVGAAVGSIRLLGVKKNRQVRQEIFESQGGKWESVRHSLFMVYFSAMMVIPGGYAVYLGLQENNSVQIILAVALVFLFLAEAYASYDTYQFYYGEKGCILKDKFVRYKSIRYITRETKLSAPEVVTFNGEKYPISMDIANIIVEKADVEIIVLK